MIILKKDFPWATFSVYSEKPDFDFFRVNQVHGDKVVETPTDIVDADGMVTKEIASHHRLAVLTADCIPLLALGKRGYALLHAGWRGVQKEIFKNIKKIKPNTFFFGPHIQLCCYEVSYEFRMNFPNSNHFHQKDNKIFFDLAGETRERLTKIYPKAEIENCRVCTCCDKIFHSYRRDKTTKRNWNIVELKD